MAPPALIIVMGTSGCGKSSIGLAVAQSLGCPFVDGDDLHPAENVAKMSRGHPLTDEDRIPWLLSIRRASILLTSSQSLALLSHPSPAEPSSDAPSPSHELQALLQKVHPDTLASLSSPADAKGRRAVVVGCSALRVCYRDLLRGKRAVMREDLVEEAADPSAGELETFFIYLKGTRPLLLHRLTSRPGHFFKSPMLDSQLNTLEPPNPEVEEGVAVIQLGKGEGETEERGLEAVGSEARDAARRWVG